MDLHHLFRGSTNSSALLLILMFIGGCAGSTNGAITCRRIWLPRKIASQWLLRIVHPHLPAGRDATGSIGTLYDIEATPTSLFIDKAGRLVEQHVGGLEEVDFRQRIDALLK